MTTASPSFSRPNAPSSMGAISFLLRHSLQDEPWTSWEAYPSAVPNAVSWLPKSAYRTLRSGGAGATSGTDTFKSSDSLVDAGAPFLESFHNIC